MIAYARSKGLASASKVLRAVGAAALALPLALPPSTAWAHGGGAAGGFVGTRWHGGVAHTARSAQRRSRRPVSAATAAAAVAPAATSVATSLPVSAMPPSITVTPITQGSMPRTALTLFTPDAPPQQWITAHWLNGAFVPGAWAPVR